MSKIITTNIESEFKKAKNNIKESASSYLLKSAVLDKNDLPKSVQNKMNKKAFISPASMPYGTSGNIKVGSPNFYHPLFQGMNLMLPRDRRERNEWCRHFYRVEPVVATSLDLHTEFPISDFRNECEDKHIGEFFDYMAFDVLNIKQLLFDIGLEYWKIGDVFPFGQLNQDEGIWDRFVLVNPDFIEIKESPMAKTQIIEIIPDANIKEIVFNGPRGEYADIYNQLPNEVVEQIRAGRNILVDSRYISHIAHKASPYEVWGTPIQMRIFKTLIYKDILREAQMAIANRHITPLRIFKVGQPGEPYPEQSDLDALRDTLMQADGDPNFMLVYHYALQTDYIGSAGRILPLQPEFDFIQKDLMNGLGINQAMLNGDGPTYANAQVGFDTLARRYMAYRIILENWIEKKVYRPIAEIQGFYKPIKSELAHGYRIANRKDRQLIVPQVKWQQQDLTSNQSLLNFVQNLYAKGIISSTTAINIAGLNPNIEEANLTRERGTVLDPNAPKGPIPGGPNGINRPQNPLSPGGKPNPEDFGFPGGPPEGETKGPEAIKNNKREILADENILSINNVSIEDNNRKKNKIVKVRKYSD